MTYLIGQIFKVEWAAAAAPLHCIVKYLQLAVFHRVSFTRDIGGLRLRSSENLRKLEPGVDAPNRYKSRTTYDAQGLKSMKRITDLRAVYASIITKPQAR
jgi:hypothetical protein